MGVLEGLRTGRGWTRPTFDPRVSETGNPATDRLAAELRAEQDTNLLLTESLADAELALEDRGWQRLTALNNVQFSRDGLARAAEVCRVMTVTNTTLKRGVGLRIAYIWGDGVQISGVDSDVNDVLQAFIDDPGNQRAVFGEQACEENERALATDGNVFIACFTKPKTGSVQVRTVGFDEIVDVIANPDDKDDPWYYLRRWTTTEISPLGVTEQRVREEFYPALGYRPLARPKFLDSKPINWDTPILHVSVNRLDGWKFGIGDVYTAVPWARAYREFLADWAQLVKALSQFAWRLTANGKTRASKAAERLRQRQRQLETAAATGTASTAGATLSAAEGYELEAIPKSGATIDSESGKPLAAMIGAGLDLPVTWLLGDPGVTGARATAETLDEPTKRPMRARRARWTQAFQQLAGHVILEAVRAPQGPLSGRITRDEHDREIVELAGDMDATVQVDWPALDDVDVTAMVAAIVSAESTQLLPPPVIARLLLQVLGVDDVDEIMADLTDANGDWINPVDAAAARSQQDAVAAGDVPQA